MPRTLRKTGLLLCLVGMLVLAFAVLSPSPAAAEFCVNQQVNNVQRCWGPPQSLETVYGHGISTGICVGEDTTPGPCAPVGQLTVLTVGRGTHQPWVTGTGSNLTYVNATAY